MRDSTEVHAARENERTDLAKIISAHFTSSSPRPRLYVRGRMSSTAIWPATIVPPSCPDDGDVLTRPKDIACRLIVPGSSGNSYSIIERN